MYKCKRCMNDTFKRICIHCSYSNEVINIGFDFDGVIYDHVTYRNKKETGSPYFDVQKTVEGEKAMKLINENMLKLILFYLKSESHNVKIITHNKSGAERFFKEVIPYHIHLNNEMKENLIRFLLYKLKIYTKIEWIN